MRLSLLTWEYVVFGHCRPRYSLTLECVIQTPSPICTTHLSLCCLELNLKRNRNALGKHTHFTLLCFSVDGLASSEAACLIKRLASGLFLCWDRDYPAVLYLICTSLAFALLHATSSCIRVDSNKMAMFGF